MVAGADHYRSAADDAPDPDQRFAARSSHLSVAVTDIIRHLKGKNDVIS